MDIGVGLLLIGVVLAASVGVALGAARLGFPAVIAFLGIGMLLGSDGPGGIAFDDAELARNVGVVSLVAILYEGGLSTSWRRLRGVAPPAIVLATLGVAVTAGITGVVGHALFALSWLEALLLGAVVATTDAAAVFATLRHTRLRRSLARTLEAESGLNDPVAIALTLGLIAWIQHDEYGLGDLTMLLVRQLTVGLVVGIALGILASWLFARLPALIAPFAPVASVATAALAFGTADVLDGSGFLSVYLVGLAVGSTPSRYRGQLVAFHEGVAYVAQVALFVVLGLLVFPSQLAHLVVAGLGLTAGLVFVARPVAVWLSLIPFRRFTRQEQALLGWAGLRGAVPIVLATFALSANLQSADTIFNAVFFVVLLSAAVQGTTLARLARMLSLTDPRPTPAAAPLEVPPLGTLDLEAFDVTPDDAIAGAAVREVGLPRGALIAVLVRGADTVTPRGSTLIKPGDRLYVLAPRSMRSVIEDVFARWRRRI